MRGYFGDQKRHYKMFKSGKHWAYMAITVAGLGVGLATFAENTPVFAATSAATTAVADPVTYTPSNPGTQAGATASDLTKTVKITVNYGAPLNTSEHQDITFYRTATDNGNGTFKYTAWTTQQSGVSKGVDDQMPTLDALKDLKTPTGYTASVETFKDRKETTANASMYVLATNSTIVRDVTYTAEGATTTTDDGTTTSDEDSTTDTPTDNTTDDNTNTDAGDSQSAGDLWGSVLSHLGAGNTDTSDTTETDDADTTDTATQATSEDTTPGTTYTPDQPGTAAGTTKADLAKTTKVTYNYGTPLLTTEHHDIDWYRTATVQSDGTLKYTGWTTDPSGVSKGVDDQMIDLPALTDLKTPDGDTATVETFKNGKAATEANAGMYVMATDTTITRDISYSASGDSTATSTDEGNDTDATTTTGDTDTTGTSDGGDLWGDIFSHLGDGDLDDDTDIDTDTDTDTDTNTSTTKPTTTDDDTPVKTTAPAGNYSPDEPGDATGVSASDLTKGVLVTTNYGAPRNTSDHQTINFYRTATVAKDGTVTYSPWTTSADGVSDGPADQQVVIPALTDMNAHEGQTASMEIFVDGKETDGNVALMVTGDNSKIARDISYSGTPTDTDTDTDATDDGWGELITDMQNGTIPKNDNSDNDSGTDDGSDATKPVDHTSQEVLKAALTYAGIDPSSTNLQQLIADYYQASQQTASYQATVLEQLKTAAAMSQMFSATHDGTDQTSQYWNAATPPVSVNYLSTTNVLDAWDKGYQGQGQLVAVIDSGVEDHKDLVLDDDTENSAEAQANIDNAKAFIEKNGYGTQVSDKIVFAYNYAANDSDATGTSGVDHGEHVAGIIAANGHTNLTAEQIAAEQTESTPDHTQARNAWLAVIQKVVANSEADANEGIPTDDEDQASKDAQDFIDQFNNSLGSDDDDDDSATGATDTTQSLTNVKIAALAKALAAAADDTTTDTAADPQTDAYSVGVAPEAQILDLRVIANNPQEEATSVAKAIYDAVALGADVINMSIGNTWADEDANNLEEAAVQYAVDHGVFVSISAANSDTRANVGAAGGNDYQPENAATLTNPSTSPAALSVAAQGDDSMGGFYKSMLGQDTADQIASFSSWGPLSDFTLKPDIAAPGVSMYSLRFDNSYASMSGTSMAAPFMSGTAALIMQRLQATTDLKGADLVATAKLLLMNSATPLYTPGTKYLISPRSQGAGAVNVGEAANKTVTAADPDKNTGSVSLYNVDNGRTFDLKFTNFGDSDVTYTFDAGAGVLTSKYVTDKEGKTNYVGTSYDMTLDGASVTPKTQTFTVKAGQSYNLQLTLNFDASVQKDQVIEGFLTFKTDSADNTITVPYLGFYGDLTDEQVFDTQGAGVTSYLENEDQLPLGLGADSDAVAVLADNGDTNFANSSDQDAAIHGAATQAQSDKVAISPNGDGDNDAVQAVVYLTQNLASATVEILDADGNVVTTVDNEADLEGSGLGNFAGHDLTDLAASWAMSDHNDALAWDGKVYDQATGTEIAAPDGKYTYRIIGTSTYDGANKTQILDLPLTVDTKAPTITSVAFDPTTGHITFTYADSGVGFTTHTLVTITIDGQDTQFALGNDGKALSGQFDLALSDAQLAALKAGDGVLKLTLHDAAGNAAAAKVTTDLGTATTKGAVDGEATDAPSFHFYLPGDSLQDISGMDLTEYGLGGDAYVVPSLDATSDTMILKAQVFGGAGTKAYVRDVVTGQVFASDKQVGNDYYFTVTGISRAAKQMSNLGGAYFVGYAITPTAEAGVYKESLQDVLLVDPDTTATPTDEPDTTVADSQLLSPFADATALKAIITSTPGYWANWNHNPLEMGYEDSHDTDNFLGLLNYDIANRKSEKGHTLDVNHAKGAVHSGVGSDADYQLVDQDLLTLDHDLELGGHVIIAAADPNYDATTGEYTISGHLQADFSQRENAQVKNAAFYILGNSTDEADPLNKVDVDADGNFSYQVKVPANGTKSVGTVLVYQLVNADGSLGEVRINRKAFVFVADQTLPTLSLAAPDTAKYTTQAATYPLSVTVDDNSDDYVLYVNGSQVFRQQEAGEPYNPTAQQPFGAYTYNANIALQLGKNVLTFVAVDQLGNQTTKTLTITRTSATTASAQDDTKTKAGKVEQEKGFAEGMRQGETGAQLQNLAGHTVDYANGFVQGYNQGQATRNHKLAAQSKAQGSATNKPGSTKQQTSTDALPKAGESTSSLSLLGAFTMASVAMAFGFDKKRKHN